MNSENLRSALSKSKDMTLKFLGRILSSTRVEPIRDDEGIKGVKACWIGEQGENSITVETDELNATLKMASDEPPTVEYLHHGETRSVAVKNINNISCAVDEETLDQFATPKGAAIAVCAGAAAGLVSWFVISVLRALAASAKEQDDNRTAAVPSQQVVDTENTEE